MKANDRNRTMNRRLFIQVGSLTAGVVAAGPGLIRARAAVSPNSRLRLAAIGTGGRAAANVEGCSSEEFVALCDADANTLEAAAKKYPGARLYRDFRVMLEKEADRIDAVLVGTPDHTHAPAAAMAMRLGKHVYCEKPLTHTLLEARTLRNLAREKKLITQMGTQIHAGDNYRRVVEIIRSGVIGAVREVHVWVNVGWEYSGGQFMRGTVPPPNLDWDLWLGPAPYRPYSEGVHPFSWRRFWDYGNGRLGDFGCHYMDLVHWALELREPVRVEARGPELDRVSPPSWLEVHYDYPARDLLPPVHMVWHGEKTPSFVGDMKDHEGNTLNYGSGQLFIGEKGRVVSDYGRHHILSEDGELKAPESFLEKSMGHHQEWIHGVKNGLATTCNFDYAGPLTEAVLLGSLAFRLNRTLVWDSEAFQISNIPHSSDLLHKEYRCGWTL